MQTLKLFTVDYFKINSNRVWQLIAFTFGFIQYFFVFNGVLIYAYLGGCIMLGMYTAVTGLFDYLFYCCRGIKVYYTMNQMNAKNQSAMMA